jgi:hypothetical protein
VIIVNDTPASKVLKALMCKVLKVSAFQWRSKMLKALKVRQTPVFSMRCSRRSKVLKLV